MNFDHIGYLFVQETRAMQRARKGAGDRTPYRHLPFIVNIRFGHNVDRCFDHIRGKWRKQ